MAKHVKAAVKRHRAKRQAVTTQPPAPLPAPVRCFHAVELIFSFVSCVLHCTAGGGAACATACSHVRL